VPERQLALTLPPVEARDAVSDLFARYAWSFDTGDVDAYVETFEDIGVLDLAGARHVGRAAIRAYASGVVADPAFVGRQHFVAQSVFEPHPRGWTVRSYAIITQRSNKASTIFLTGHYRDLCISVDGQWLFAERIFRTWDGAVLSRFASNTRS